MKVKFKITNKNAFEALIEEMRQEHEGYYARYLSFLAGYQNEGEVHSWTSSTGNHFEINFKDMTASYSGTRHGFRGEWRHGIQAGTNCRPVLYETSEPSLKWDEFMSQKIYDGSAPWETALKFVVGYMKRRQHLPVLPPRFEFLKDSTYVKNERALCAQYIQKEVAATRAVRAAMTVYY